jgi:hypothetical protein
MQEISKIKALILKNKVAENAFQELRNVLPTEMVQCSYDHFPTLRSIIWVEGIAMLSDMYFNGALEAFYEQIEDDAVPEFYVGLQESIQRSRKSLKSAKEITHSTKQSNDYAETGKFSHVCKNLVLPGAIFSKCDVQFQNMIWNVRENPDKSTVSGVDLDETLFEGPILLELTNFSETILYRVAVCNRKARATLMAIHRFYKVCERNYKMGNLVWVIGIIETSPNIWRLDLRDCSQAEV